MISFPIRFRFFFYFSFIYFSACAYLFNFSGLHARLSWNYFTLRIYFSLNGKIASFYSHICNHNLSLSVTFRFKTFVQISSSSSISSKEKKKKKFRQKFQVTLDWVKHNFAMSNLTSRVKVISRRLQNKHTQSSAKPLTHESVHRMIATSKQVKSHVNSIIR